LVEGEAREAVTPVRQKCHVGVQALRRGGNMAEPRETDGLKNTLFQEVKSTMELSQWEIQRHTGRSRGCGWEKPGRFIYIKEEKASYMGDGGDPTYMQTAVPGDWNGSD